MPPTNCKTIDIEVAKKMTLEEIMAANPIVDKDLKLIPGSSSTYAVVTYWWGCGNINRNTQLPCPEDIKEALGWGEELDITMQPVKYEAMIHRFGQVCAKAKCHYIAKQYPEFAVPGGYQKAINAKPLFIKEALDAAKKMGLRGVLYIDGDMDMLTCPKVFDMPDIDVALRGWNMDPRSSAKAVRTGKICFDSHVLETSGGTMFFSTSEQSYYLLDAWARLSASPGRIGKADDRILSELITANDLHISMNIVQLPIEYLWLSQAYDDKKGPIKQWRKGALITHPYCLTGEERAADQGAAG